MEGLPGGYGRSEPRRPPLAGAWGEYRGAVSGRTKLALTRLTGTLLALLLAATAASAQDYFTATRRDEVGPRTLDFDEETFLNILSFEQPLETEQDWLRSEGGFRTAFG